MTTAPHRHRDAASRTLGRRAPISQDRFIDRFHHKLAKFVLVGYVLFLVYVSLLPFGNVWQREQETGLPEWSEMISSSAGMKDVLPNILLYVPLGVAGYIVARNGGGSRILAIVCAFLLGVVLSIILELLQQWVPIRVSSWVDVVCNSVGGLIGGLLGRVSHWLVRELFKRFRSELRNMPISTTARAYVVLLVLTGILPLDFTFDWHRVGLSAKHANLVPFRQLTTWQVETDRAQLAGHLPSIVTLRRIQADYWLDMTAEAASFALAGLMIALSLRREHRAGRFSSWLLAGLWSGLLAIWLSVLQFFIMSRGFDATAIVVRAAGAFLGAWVAVWLISHTTRSLPRGVNPGLPSIGPRLATLLTVCVMAYIYCRGFSPFVVGHNEHLTKETWLGMNLLPLANYLESRVYVAADDILYKILRYGLLGWLIAVTVGLDCSRSYRHRALRIGLAGGLISLSIEFTQTFIPTRWPDLTHVLLGAFGSYCGAIGARLAGDYYQAVRTPLAARPEPVFNVEIPAPDAAQPREPSPVERAPSLDMEIPPPDEAAPKELPSEDEFSKPDRKDNEIQ